jgi:hypothetical protein
LSKGDIDLSEYLESATLKGQRSVMPGIPNRKISGAFYADPTQLEFRSEGNNFSLGIDWYQIKECSVFNIDDDGVGGLLASLSTLSLITPKQWHMRLLWFSAAHDQDLWVDFYIATSNGSFLAERRAVALAKSIWTLRSVVISQIRSSMAITYRGV